MASVTEKLPDMPAAHQPPMTVPVEPYEPPPYTPVGFSEPPLAAPVESAGPPPPAPVKPYESPSHSPVDFSEPSPAAPVDFSEPPPTAPVVPYQPVPSPPQQSGRPGSWVGLVVVFAIVWLVAVVAVYVQVRERAESEESATAAAQPVMAAPPAPPTATAAGDLTWPELWPKPADAEAELRSSVDGLPTVIHFENLSGETVTIMWLDYDHQRVRYLDLSYRQGYDQQTYTGHVWVVIRADGTTTAVYQAEAASSRATIR